MEPPPRKYGDLEIEENLRDQRIQWRVERVWTVVLFALLVGALLGVFGRGPLSVREEESGEVRVSYDRFVRNDSPFALRVTAESPGETLEVTLPASYLRQMAVESVQPEPESEELRGGTAVYSFSVPDGEGEAQVTFRLRPQTAGRVTAMVEAGGEDFALTHFVYP